MSWHYNPIVRTFAQLRSELMTCLGAARHEVRPSTRLELLIPIERRRGVWHHLRQHGLAVPDLVRIAPWRGFSLDRVVELEERLLQVLGLIEPWEPIAAVHFPIETVGELVLYLTSFREHRASGYRWTHREISMRVRIIIAKSLGLPLAEVQPETTFFEMGCD